MPSFPVLDWLLAPEPPQSPGHLWPRWLWLRALGLVFFSAFYSLVFQIRGLIGPDGILPAGHYLRAVAAHFGVLRFWFAPTLLWWSSGPTALKLICWAGLIASILLTLNLWPRATIAVCLICFLSFVSAAQDFSGYQSDGMLLSAGFLSLFFAPAGLRPGLGAAHPPSRASRLMLLWLWFTIYFESGLVKLASHDPQWRHLTAMDEYYQNGPLPNWIGWYAQQLPHWYQAAITLATLTIELGVVWMLFLPRRFRLVCFCIVTPFQIGIILTSNLTFLNHFVLALGILLLDDRLFHALFPRLGSKLDAGNSKMETRNSRIDAGSADLRFSGLRLFRVQAADLKGGGRRYPAGYRSLIKRFLSMVFLGWILYNTAAELMLILVPALPLPTTPIEALEPFRISNQYGLFAVMTTARYEIEFQGTRDGINWIPYPFRYKPQDPHEPPRVYAPYQPRLDWNLWFATLGPVEEYPWVVHTEVLLLENDPVVLALFAGNPFADQPPLEVRAVRWQYWFTDRATKRKNGLWWRRELLGLYAPVVKLGPDGKPVAVEWPEGGAR